MFGGASYQMPSTGKKMIGFPTRKNEFSLGWSSNQMNEDQNLPKRGKNKEITGKITTNIPSKRIASNGHYEQYENPTNKIDQYRSYEQYKALQPLPSYIPSYAPHQYQYASQNPYQQPTETYNEPAYDYNQYYNDKPDKTEELEKIMYQYDQKRINQTPAQSNQSERRAPIKPKESMKDIIYNNIGVGEVSNGRKPSRNMNSNSLEYSYGKNRN